MRITRLRFGTLMHDLAIWYPWLDHDRWCAPSPELMVTSRTAPVLIFLPVVIWALLLAWWHTHARGRRPRVTREDEATYPSV